MSDAAAAAPRITCEGCGKTYVWKPELAGKKVKCKCGQVMTVPQSMQTVPAQEEDLYDFAPSSEPVKPKSAPRVPLAPAAPRTQGGGVATAAAAVGTLRPAGAPAGLGFPGAPIKKPVDRMTNQTLVDKPRDIYVPIALLVAGVLLYISYYVIRFQLAASGVPVAAFGILMMTAFKAALMMGFAFVVADKIGVSFGGVLTAALKLAAIAVFVDGVCSWVDFGVDRMTGVALRNISGWGAISFPVALGIYWVLLIYLFSMDPGDSWLVVVLLAVFDRIVKMVLVLILLKAILTWGGASSTAMASLMGSPPTPSDPVSVEINEIRGTNRLVDAREYIKDGHQGILRQPVEDWHANGCKEIWFVVSRDINGRPTAEGLYVELPKEKDKRAKCFEIRRQYYKDAGFGAGEAEEDKDTGQRWMEVGFRG